MLGMVSEWHTGTHLFERTMVLNASLNGRKARM